MNTATTPKAANGTATPKSAKDAKSTKAKPPSKKKKPTADTVTETEADDTEMSAQEKHQKKHVRILTSDVMGMQLIVPQKEVLFIRHKLQKGLLDKAQAPKAEEMESMNEWMSSLEKVQPMEESIIASTKIHKLLKAIIKVGHTIPNNDEHKLKERATALLEQWGQTPAPENSFARHDATHGGENGTTGTDSADGAKAAAMPETEKEEAADAAAAKTVEDDAVDKTKETQEKVRSQSLTLQS